MKKRTFALLLSVVLCFGLMGTAFASGRPVYEDGEWKFDTPSAAPTAPTESTNPSPEPSRRPGGSTSSGGSSGGSSSTTVNRRPSANGNAGGNVLFDNVAPDQGAKVTFTVTPDAGFVAENVSAKDANGNNVILTNEGNGKYSFTQPATAVTVTVKFSPVAPSNPFVDVAQGAYYYDAVLWAVRQGITTGTSATTFSPNETCTRAQTVTFLWRAAGSPIVAAENPFTDVAAGAYYYNAVLWAVQQGVTNGTSATTFSPDDTVTRGQTVTFQYRAAKAQAVTGSNPFVDVAAGEFYAEAVQWAVNNGVTNGTSATTFGPDEGCTRGQIVTFLYRAR